MTDQKMSPTSDASQHQIAGSDKAVDQLTAGLQRMQSKLECNPKHRYSVGSIDRRTTVCDGCSAQLFSSEYLTNQLSDKIRPARIVKWQEQTNGQVYATLTFKDVVCT